MVINALGQQVLSRMMEQTLETLDLSGMAGGVYYIHLHCDNFNGTDKIILR
jgi:hypothetical protein